MALTIEDKKAIVTEVAEVAASAHSMIAADFRGLSVSELTGLRATARASGVYLKVVRNTLARRAVEGTDFDCIKSELSGPLMLAFSREEPGAAARLLKEFTKDNDKLKVRLVSVGGQLLEPSEINRLADLPTRETAISLLMAVMKAPIEKLARTLNEPHAKLVRTIAAVRDQKQSTT